MSASEASPRTMPANAVRGLLELLSLCMICVGAGVLWGVGGVVFSLGVALFIEIALDEIIERVTGVVRK